EFDEYPRALDEIVIKTEPRGVNKIIASRDFEIWNSQGSRLGRAASNWTLVDLNTKSILPIAKVIPFMIHFEKRESDMNFTKIMPPEKPEFEKTFEIRFDDIDVNRHVNNANYIVWAFEALPYDFKAQYRLKILDIAYKKEIAFGHKVVSCVQISEENGQKVSLHAVKNATTQEELCLVKALWI
ncbi:MAG TPA: thioesterase, partial [Candidatus Gastranaerophilaceae bacterium]|nr:thioesterase [Candidatus Gastranaerophilaceae bacterium]